jgi:hypothetical protein
MSTRRSRFGERVGDPLTHVSALCLSMIFSENRIPLFGIML